MSRMTMITMITKTKIKTKRFSILLTMSRMTMMTKTKTNTKRFSILLIVTMTTVMMTMIASMMMMSISNEGHHEDEDRE